MGFIIAVDDRSSVSARHTLFADLFGSAVVRG